MSAQETNFKAIADAIREKEGTTDTIPAREFAERIRAISTVPDGLHTITVATNDPEVGHVTGGGTASRDMRVTVTAEAAEAYIFSQWSENGETVSQDSEYTFPVSGDRNLTAVFTDTRGSRLPEGYTEVEYIAGAGGVVSAYRPYLTIPTTTGAVELKFAFSCSNQSQLNASLSFMLGKNRSTATTAAAKAWYAFGASRGEIEYYYGNNNNIVTSIAAVQDVKYDVDIHGANKILEVNGTVTALSAKSTWMSKEFDIFTVHNVNNSYHSISSYVMQYVTLYYLQLLDENENLLRHLVPCIDSSGIVGMYDIVTDTFFGNKNTNTDSQNKFTAGPAV